MNEYKGNDFTARELKEAKARMEKQLEQMQIEHENFVVATAIEREREFAAKVDRCKRTIETLEAMIERAEEREKKTSDDAMRRER